MPVGPNESHSAVLPGEGGRGEQGQGPSPRPIAALVFVAFVIVVVVSGRAQQGHRLVAEALEDLELVAEVGVQPEGPVRIARDEAALAERQLYYI